MFALIQDDDGHWFVIPSNKRKETEESKGQDPDSGNNP